jgi:hypothetical protein
MQKKRYWVIPPGTTVFRYETMCVFLLLLAFMAFAFCIITGDVKHADTLASPDGVSSGSSQEFKATLLLYHLVLML